jgi:trehalose-phosphatase
VLLSDYDGTLTPIVSHPAAAFLSASIRAALQVLTAHRRYRVAIISGRALADLRRRVAGKEVYLAGNHGLQIEGPGSQFVYPEAQVLRPHIQALAHALRRDLAEIPGVFIEDKGFSLSVHYRQVPEVWVAAVQERLRARASPAIEAGRLTLRAGKAVFEVRPRVPWDKGEAVRWIVERLGYDLPAANVLPIYLGDDDTDEDAFRVVNSTGVAIVVGGERRHSAAQYYVESVEEVERFLRALSALA